MTLSSTIRSLRFRNQIAVPAAQAVGTVSRTPRASPMFEASTDVTRAISALSPAPITAKPPTWGPLSMCVTIEVGTLLVACAGNAVLSVARSVMVIVPTDA